MRVRKIFALTSVAGIWTLLAFSALVLSSTNLALFVQKLFGIPGPHFEIGSARVSVGQNWLLRAYKLSQEDSLRLYGMVPLLKKDKLPGRYLEFSIISGEAENNFFFAETDAAFNKRLLSVSRGELVPNWSVIGCRVEEDFVAGITGNSVSYGWGYDHVLARCRNSLILYPTDADPRKYSHVGKR